MKPIPPSRLQLITLDLLELGEAARALWLTRVALGQALRKFRWPYYIDTRRQGDGTIRRSLYLPMSTYRRARHWRWGRLTSKHGAPPAAVVFDPARDEPFEAGIDDAEGVNAGSRRLSVVPVPRVERPQDPHSGGAR